MKQEENFLKEQRLHKIGTYLAKRWFLIGMFIMIFLAMTFPKLGGALNPDKWTATIMIIGLFFLSGLSLPTETVKEGMKDIRLHVLIQVFIFVVCPLYFMVTAIPFSDVMSGRLIIGIYALACLPTTVSSCIIFTQLSNGNTVGSVFNASLSNLGGVFLSPLLLTFFLKSSGNSIPFDEIMRIFQNLVLQILLPFIIGQFCHNLFRGFARKYKSLFGYISNFLVLCILYFGVARSAEDAVLQTYWPQLIVPFIYLAVSHVILIYLSYVGSRLMKLSRSNTIAVIYTAPQKTLSLGIPLLSTYFVNQPEILGIALLPILFYHPWQLFVAGLLKNSRFIERPSLQVLSVPVDK